MYKHSQGLKSLFVSEEWNGTKLSTIGPGKAAAEIVLFFWSFWHSIKNCMRASQPLLIALRIADGGERPAMLEIMAAMDAAKMNIKEALQHKQDLLNEVLGIVDKRWNNQMEQKLYGMFNDVLWKMVTDDDKQSKISRQADDYEMAEGVKIETERVLFFSGGAYGGLAYELQCLAKQIISLCCSASGCERKWSTFAFIHTKKRNRLEHKRLNGLVYISNNRKMSTRFQKLREQGSKGKKSNPLILEEFQWDNEWVDINVEPVHQGGDHITWVDEVIGASRGQRGRNHSRRACGDVVASGSSDRPIGLHITYARHSKLAASVDEVGHENEDAAKDDDFAVADVEIDNEDIESETPSTHAGGASRQEDEFELDDDLDS